VSFQIHSHSSFTPTNALAYAEKYCNQWFYLHRVWIWYRSGSPVITATICPWGSGVGGRTNSINRLGHRWLAGQSSAARGNYTGLYCAVMQTGHESYPIHVHTTSTKWRNIWNETVVTRTAQAWDILMAVAVLRNVVFPCAHHKVT
jgi:hypothetical protein